MTKTKEHKFNIDTPMNPTKDEVPFLWTATVMWLLSLQ